MSQTATEIKIKSIDITAKEWFDKVNGNSYFSAQATINFGMPDQKIIYVPYQYGYGSQYEYTTFKALQEAELIPKQESIKSPWRYYEENGIISRHTKHENCKKRDVIAWGHF